MYTEDLHTVAGLGKCTRHAYLPAPLASLEPGEDDCLVQNILNGV